MNTDSTKSRRRAGKLALGVLALGMTVMSARSAHAMNLDSCWASQNVIDCRGLSSEACHQAHEDFDSIWNRAKRAVVDAWKSVWCDW